MNKFLAVITLLCIAACGGGGGGGGNVTTAPLSLSDATPTKGATGVSRTTVVVLTFSAPLDAATLGASTTTLASPAGNQAVGLSATGNKLTITPSGELSPLTTYTLTIGAGLRGNGGEQLAGSVTTSFTTGDRQWQTAVPIETGDVNIAEDPQIAVDARGDAVVVWRRSDSQGTRVWSNRYTAGTGWGTALAIGPDLGPSIQGPVRTPQVAMDANGNAIAVWPQFDGGNYKIWAARYTAGTGWITAISLEPNAGTASPDVAANPQIKLDANGNAIAVWERYNSVSSRIWSSRYSAGAGWGTAAIIDDNAVTAGSAQIAFDPNGNAIAVWEQLDNVGYHVWATRYTAATNAWGTARMIQNDDSVQAFNAQVAIDTAGNALVVWLRSDSAQHNEIWSNRYAAGADWGVAARISDTGGGAGSPQIAMDANGDVLAVWSEVDSGSSSSVRWNRYTPGGGWGTAATIEPGDGTPQIACDASGNAIAVWERRNGVNSEVWSSRYTVGGGWAPGINPGSTAAVLDPVVAVDSTGNAFAAWQQEDSSNIGLVWANKFE